MRRKSPQPPTIASSEPVLEMLAPVLATEATPAESEPLSRTQKWADRWANRLRHDASQAVHYPNASRSTSNG